MTKRQELLAKKKALREQYLRDVAEVDLELEQEQKERIAAKNAKQKAKGKGKAEREAQARANEEAMERLKRQAEYMANAKAAKAWAFAVHPDHGGTNVEFIKAHRTWKHWEAMAAAA